jgi:hypothetical protein
MGEDREERRGSEFRVCSGKGTSLCVKQ